MDWAVVNNGSCTTPQTFNVKFYIDGVLKNTYIILPLAPNAWEGRNDIVIIIGNSIAVALNIFMLFLKIKYSRNPLDEES